MCPYNSITPTYDLVMNANVMVSANCDGGSAAYGYERLEVNHGTVDIGIGCTFTGNNFCTAYFRGDR
jgi:hypothetical protein